jgi:acyl-coenzyme A synthetase/AMP-(fatty) acid ligase
MLLLLARRQHMPDHAAAAGLSVPLLCYEQLLDEAAESGALGSFKWPRLHEDSPAGLCYTSGTTGNPKVGFLQAGVFLQAAFLYVAQMWCVLRKSGSGAEGASTHKWHHLVHKRCSWQGQVAHS